MAIIRNISITVKEGDYWNEDINLTSETVPISSWSNFECDICPPAVLTTDVTAGIISGAVTLGSEDGYLNIKVADTETDDLVPKDSPSVTYYSDLRGEDQEGLKRTIRTIRWTINRKWSSS